MAESSGLKPGNGSSHVNGKMNGQTTAKKQPSPRRQGLFAWVFGVAARIATWAIIITLLFRCPSSLEECDQDSPFICKPYFQAKATIAPYTLPYYEQYAAPYVDFAKPYYETVDARVLTPARTYAVQYGAPWVEKGQQQALAQWEKHGQPQVAQLRELSRKQYEQTIAPHLERAGEALGPYYEIGRTSSLQLYHDVLLPAYGLVQPYAHQGYTAASSFTTGTALPAVQWTWAKTNAFLDKAVWPQLRMLYVENVEPQLVRIGERLERYKNRARTKVLPDVTSATTKRRTTTEPPRYSSFSKPSPQGTPAPTTAAFQSEAPTPSSSVEKQPVTESYWNPVQPPAPAENETEQRRTAREMVAQDLEMWQNKFAAQADEGAVDMEDRIEEIAGRRMSEDIARYGKPLVKKLRATVQAETDRLKTKISSIVAEHARGALDDAQEQIIGAVRSAGLAIKTAAQDIRSWREEYDENLQSEVLKAADVHFEILDETTNLALQQLGMKWAWTEGVTYKDWAKYHELKQALAEWTEELKQLIVTHPTLLRAQDASAQIEDEGMTIASAAAKELARLKQVALWKLAAKDSSDNFDSEAMERAAEAAQNPTMADNVTEPVAQEEEDNATAGESPEAAVESGDANDSSQPVTDAVLGAVLEAVSEEAAATETDEAVLPSEPESADETKDDAFVDEQSSSVESSETQEDNATSDVFEHVMEQTDTHPEGQKPLAGQTDDVPEPAGDAKHDEESAPVIPEAASIATEPATEAVLESEPDETVEAVLESEDEILEEDDETLWPQDTATQKAAPTVKASFLGAAAQVVPGRQIVLDEDDDDSDDDYLSSASKAAEAAYSSAVSLASDRYSKAVSIISAQVRGTPTPAVENQLLSSVSAAYDQALAAASSRLKEFADAASAGVYGTPTPTQATPSQAHWSRVESIAADRLNEGKLWAELQYQSALIALGLATPTPTPTNAAEKYYEQAKYNYYAGVGLAHDRYNNFISAASSAWSSLTATPTPTPQALTDSAISMASAAGQAAESVYSKATENVASAIEAVDESISSLHNAATEQVYNAGLAIGETWGTVVSQLSLEIYGQPTPAAIGWYDSLTSNAQAAVASATSAVGKAGETASAGAANEYEAVSELVSELIVGREPPFTESVLSRLQAAYASATQNVASMASGASAAAGSVGEKVGSMASKATDAAKHGRDEL
ncbi:hypothetical protein BBK36DRAFT_1159198 [Trichoderma citrinoviride]|uniref:Transcription factor hoxa13 n=1 Tax=Trichoderma citrinoviride TaxID=58853 RepID=A0A2T4BA84_9HYPO|nr:hypothetical protein BBK36DRAFT_1159198 [Trichoderma citrinoviride]PTB66141.1 hypothetical protein BBK36DRAFT_1159198 [Trichoderma citrinoviride]